MLNIKNRFVKHVSSHADYELENGILLFSTDWNGEVYSNGFDPEKECDTNREYKPVYKEISEDEFEIVGFDEF